MGDFPDGRASSYQPRPTGLNFGEQTGTGVSLGTCRALNFNSNIQFWMSTITNFAYTKNERQTTV